jgi:hypothetical protein
LAKIKDDADDVIDKDIVAAQEIAKRGYDTETGYATVVVMVMVMASADAV